MVAHRIKPGEITNPKGRPKGAENKLSRAAKDVILAVADRLAVEGGGAEVALWQWAQRSERNEYAFWTLIYPKILAQRVDVTRGGQPLMMRIEQVILQQGEDEEPIIEGVDYFEVPSSDPEIEARVQKESGRFITHEYDIKAMIRSDDREEEEE